MKRKRAEYAGLRFSPPRVGELTSPVAQRLADMLGSNSALGYVNARGQEPPPADTMLAEVEAAKRQHPHAVVLTRVGDFYVAYGIDAVTAVEHGRVRPSGMRSCEVSVHAAALRETLDALVAANQTVAVYEEVYDANPAHVRQQRKTRYLGGLVSAARPVYDAGLGSHDVPHRDGLPHVGILSSSSGVTVCLVRADERTCRVWDRLTLGGADAFMAAGYAQPVYVQGLDGFRRGHAQVQLSLIHI